jgi:hypothetical protein
MPQPALDGESSDDPSAGALASRIVRAWNRDYLAKQWVLSLLGIAFAAYLIYLAALGPAPSTAAANDVFLLLDGGWRILNGLVPYRDFDLALGPLTYMSAAAGLWVAHYDVRGLTLGLLAFGAITTLIAFWISRARMTAAGAILFSAFVLLLCTSPTPLGENSSTVLTYAMIYNRFGYGLLSIVFVTQLLPPKKEMDGQDYSGSIVTGSLLVGLLFLKLSYFGIAAGLTLLSICVDFRNIRRVGGIAAGAASALFIMFAFIRFHVGDFIRNSLDTVHARAGDVHHFGLTDLLGLNSTLFLALVVSICFFGREGGTRRKVLLIAAAFYTMLAEALFARTNTFQGAATFPLYIVFVLVLLAGLDETLARKRLPRQYAAALLVISFAFALPLLYSHIRSLTLLTTYKLSSHLREAAYRVRGAHLQGLAFYDYVGEDELMRAENGHFYVSALNQGIDLLKQYSTNDDLVTNLGYHNPFSYALLRRPAHGGNTYFQVGSDIAMDRLPSSARMFGEATIVMVPKYPSTHLRSDQLLFDAYKSELSSRFSLAAESEAWRLYKRNSK